MVAKRKPILWVIVASVLCGTMWLLLPFRNIALFNIYSAALNIVFLWLIYWRPRFFPLCLALFIFFLELGWMVAEYIRDPFPATPPAPAAMIGLLMLASTGLGLFGYAIIRRASGKGYWKWLLTSVALSVGIPLAVGIMLLWRH
ncbi:MAG: hypothetical protein WCF84_09245 [Anaerolineae bacterium]